MSAAPPDRKVAAARLWATSKAPYLASAIFASSVRLDPGGWQRWAETVLPSRTDWRRAPAAEIRRGIALTAGTVDYSYHRPARRAHLHDDIVLPTMVRPVPEVAIVCDTSGSMHDGLLARALAEVDGILRRAGLTSSRRGLRGTSPRRRRSSPCDVHRRPNCPRFPGFRPGITQQYERVFDYL